MSDPEIDPFIQFMYSLVEPVKKEDVDRIREQYVGLKTLAEKEAFIERLEPEEVHCLTDDELLSVFKETKNRRVCEKCVETINIMKLVELLEGEELTREMMFKLTLAPSTIVISALVARKETDTAILMQIIRNNRDTGPNSIIDKVLNHKKMDEPTIWRIITEIKNDYIMSRVLLNDKVSTRIIKKLQEYDSQEIKDMAKALDPETDVDTLRRIIKQEKKKMTKSKARMSDSYQFRDDKTLKMQKKSVMPTDIVEAYLKNPNAKLEELGDFIYKFPSSFTIVCIIPHPKISKNLLDKYKRNGSEPVSQAAQKRLAKIGKDEDIRMLS